MNHGATQVVIAKLPKTKSRLAGSATLSYVDAVTSEKVSTTLYLSSQPLCHDRNQRSIKRNYAIALVADAIRSAAESSNNGDNQQAEKQLAKGIRKARKIYSNREDENVNRVHKIAGDYRKMLNRD